MQVRAQANRWLAGKIYYKLKLTNCKYIYNIFCSCNYTYIVIGGVD